MAVPITERDLLGLVSYHAVTRYVQRILGVEVRASGYAAQIAAAHCAAAGLSLDEVRTAIMTPAVVLALVMKVPFVNTRAFRAQLSPETGFVVTIYEPRRRPTRKLSCNPSRQELKRRSKKLTRQQKRMPSRQRREAAE